MGHSKNDLEGIFERCRKKSMEIIKLSLEVLEELKSTDSPIFKKIKAEYSFIPIKQIQRYSINSVDRLIIYAEKFLKEKEAFDILEELEDNYAEYELSYPFITRVWSGDIFDASEMKGFVMLEEELKSNFSILNNEESFINFVRKNYLATY